MKTECNQEIRYTVGLFLYIRSGLALSSKKISLLKMNMQFNMTLRSSDSCSSPKIYEGGKKGGQGTVWRPVNNPISRRTDERKSVTSDPVTQMQCSSPESALSRGGAALKGTEVFEVIFLFRAPNSQPHSMVLACSLLAPSVHQLSLQSLPKITRAQRK